MRDSVSTTLIAGLTVLGSLALACATPFAAIAAFAAGNTGRSLGLCLVLLAWLSNQIIGFAILSYPMTGDAFAWGGAIGLGAVLAYFASRRAIAITGRGLLGQTIAFLASFAVFELALFSASVFLGAAADAFSLATIAKVFSINLAAFIAVLIVSRLLAAVAPFGPPAKPIPSAG